MTSYDNAIEQARALREAGAPQRGYALLNGVLDDAMGLEARARVAAEKQACLLAMDSEEDMRRRLLLFNGALMLFYQVTDILPDYGPAYECQAAFWERLGDAAMGRRLMRTLSCLRGGALPENVDPVAKLQTAPEWHVPACLPKILFVMPGRPHYGLDVLYDGLCEVLGDDRVREFPWKPSLHGAALTSDASYPCGANRDGVELTANDVVGLLRAGEFDAVLWGDFDGAVDAGLARQISEAAGDVPFFLIDAEDECTDRFADVLGLLGRQEATGCFKREMLTCVDYGERVAPLPFAYPNRLVLDEAELGSREGFFWAGQRWCGLRDVYLRRLEAIVGETFDASYDQREYVERMRQASMGLSGFGAGFDSVRYWELPAQGCMLLAERSPLRIPHDFVDGESAVLFGDLAELEEKFRYYVRRPELAREIAREGHRHLRNYHTGSARARQVLGWMDAMSTQPHRGRT